MVDEGADAAPTPLRMSRGTGVRIVVLLLLLCVVVPVGSCVGCLAIGSRVADGGRGAATSIIDSVSRPWSAPAVLAHADDDFTKTVPYEKLAKLVGWFDRRLGNLESCQPVTVGNWRANAGTSGFIVVSTYLADCQFERAKGQVTLHLVRRDRWRIRGLHVNSDALMDSE